MAIRFYQTTLEYNLYTPLYFVLQAAYHLAHAFELSSLLEVVLVRCLEYLLNINLSSRNASYGLSREYIFTMFLFLPQIGPEENNEKLLRPQ